ncbi:hypothetical protein ILYODFUR_027596 [Ilyodon furcidens]|uniref:Uncharacterized protein n=1 Tax=Ilyodon furcidens TaxID=33524 RepID=A0ABV0TZZ7_9TELE
MEVYSQRAIATSAMLSSSPSPSALLTMSLTKTYSLQIEQTTRQDESHHVVRISLYQRSLQRSVDQKDKARNCLKN